MTSEIDVAKLTYAEKILCELLGVGSSDLEAIYEMEEHHPGTIDLAFELFEDEKPNFGSFVLAVKYQALKEIENLITSNDYDSFEDMLMDDDYVAWGAIVSYGSYEGDDVEANRERQELFAEYVKGTMTKEAFARRYAELLPQAKKVG
jgi:hypothetical protein